MAIRKQDALNYHALGRRGKIEVTSSKPCRTAFDLSLAYTPGVAEPCREIEKDIENVYRYTAKGNLVAVVSNGTAVLGLGDIGAAAGKPVMEGKGVLFKRFADIDVFDLELDTHNPDEIIRTVQLLEPTFGGINLEDIKAPDCFYIEETLKKTMNIPVFHDDQHGTAIISGAALINALELVGKDISKVRVVFNGAGAAGIACANHYVRLGVKRENVTLCDSVGVIYKGREKGMNPYKEQYAQETRLRTLAEAMVGADVFCGVSVANCVTKDMVRSMNSNPVVFAMANPDPEITYEDAKSARSDLIMATGRSDYPNQVNNVLGFPFIFRGALDVRAKAITEEMKIAATYALAQLAKQDVPDTVMRAYGGERFKFGPDYIIPKPFDPRVLVWEASAVAKAAMDGGIAAEPVNLEEYKEQLEMRLGRSRELIRHVVQKARKDPKRIVFPEGEEEKILRAANILVDENIARPILLGNSEIIQEKIKQLDLSLEGIEVIDPEKSPLMEKFVMEFHHMRRRKGVSAVDAREFMKNRNYFGTMMVHFHDCDGLISGLTQQYPETIRPALQILKTKSGTHRVSGLYILMTKKDTFFFADTTVNIDPTPDELAEIAMGSAEVARAFDVEPRIAMLSFSNFGSTNHPFAEKVRVATEIVKQLMPDLMIDGEMQADTAVVPEIINETYPFSTLKGGANVLIFPNLEAGNIAYKLMMRIGGAEAVGPILMGIGRPVHVLQHGAEVNDIVNMTAIAVVDAQLLEKQTREMAAASH
ncbi:MAG: phosphate acetyltransferase [Acidobacteriia bacterium]|nr:phosphate acetyltransferase [Terriglobia bacterium]